MSIVLDLQSQSNYIITTTFSLDLPLIKKSKGNASSEIY